jgi:anti-sigma B factor antagonist
MTTMELTVSYEDGYVLGATLGAIDESAGDGFRDLLHPLIAQSGTRLILDLSRSDRINSLGLAQLIRLVADANTHGSRVVLAAPTPFVGQVFDVTKLNTFFSIQPSLSLAIESLNHQG